ncbi:DNA repair protein XRCC4 isoform X2 [Salvelinus namaycush]|uniref:DNA repair protein XRCC4 isoform X2 n=1 Tax=Salvelinus namaycush TaxID=8040 RepID=A0A8U0P921_SALNM|nr:DNA repair protein XRCC4 isoform X2 [Salvelinus namaycush]
MHVTVREVRISSESETSYFLRVEWRGRDLGSGFLLLLTDGQNAWRGEVSEDAVREEAEELEMQTDRYIQDLQQALTGTGPSTDYSFTLTYNPGPMANMTLAYEKVQRDISFCLGSVLLGKIPEPVEEVRALLTHGLERGTALQNHNHLLKEENHRLKQELQHINAELQRFVSGKETLESELYSRFTLVLNEKKAKIRSLQKNLTHLQETREEGESSSPGKGTKKTTGQTREGDEYEASTDEEQLQPASIEPTQGTSRSRSPLDDSLNDITDVAPSRKRRFRHLQPPDTVAKRPTSEPAQKPRLSMF